ncbi:SLC13 family permease [Chelatococcus sp. SYSU_G07232]|uniref:SLC13 family permease n=1 Tax=Chelatococcus albus TaxID=3047466 RepID=A0ABT7AF16_9HYPH|nr:SLC13 family permease [Chelatococcus sp. SYSU_G07232]MDJ1157967.1 SLC13 family permease [Chelatococcus sp. SYSU_G07232]
MTLDQALAFAIVIAMMGLFVWGRLRYDVVAMIALLAAVAAGVVPADRAFAGFGDDIVIIVASALVVSAAVGRSGMIELVLRRVGPYLKTTGQQVFALVAAVTLMSAIVKNIAALAMLMPVAFHLARRTDTSPSYLLMPMAFGSLIGGIMTLVGTSPNVIVSRVRAETMGEPFRMFDFTPVGASIAVAGVIFLTVGYRLLPAARKGTASIEAAFNIEDYTTEASVPPDSSIVGKTVGDLEKLAEGEVEVTRIIRGHLRRFSPSVRRIIEAGDILLLEGEPAALERVVARAKLKLAREDAAPGKAEASDEIGVMEAVVTGDSLLIDRTPLDLRLYERFQINVLAVSRRGERIKHQMRAVQFRAGDVVVLQGNLKFMPEILGELGCLPLAERELRLGASRRSLLPVVILGAAMVLMALNIVPVAVAFFGAAVALLVTNAISLKEAYGAIEWPILVMFGALIPVSDAIRTTGGTDLIAGWLSMAAEAMPPLGALALILVAAMAVTPFLNNAATVLVMAPIAAGFASKLGYRPDPFLMAVAIGAACDFLTPIGHQSNTLVMGPGGYRFGDYWRLGLPLSIIVVIVGVPLIAFFWPLVGR